MGLRTWLDRVADGPTWLDRLDDRVEARGLGRHKSRCFFAQSHERRRVAKRAAGAALVLALSSQGPGPMVFGFLFAALFTLYRFPHEDLRVPPSRAWDGLQAAGFGLVPWAVLEIAGVRPADTLAGEAQALVLPLAWGAAGLLLIDSWFFTRAIWYTCGEGLVASNGRGRIRTSFRWGDIRTHRIECRLRRMWFWQEVADRRFPDSWWLTLADGRKEYLPLHMGTVLYPEHGGFDPLSKALADGLARSHEDEAREALARGETLAFGRITASSGGLRIRGATVSWSELADAPVSWGRRGWNGRWKVRGPYGSRVRSVVVVKPSKGKALIMPTRDIDNFFVLSILRRRHRW